MRKRRRLADKMTIMVCAVLIAVSAFFYAPMEAYAYESYVVSGGNNIKSSTEVNFYASGVSASYFEAIVPLPLFAWTGQTSQLLCQSDVVVVSTDFPLYPSLSVTDSNGPVNYNINFTSAYLCFNGQEFPLSNSNWVNARFDSSVYKGSYIHDCFYIRVCGTYSYGSTSLNSYVNGSVNISIPSGKNLVFNFADGLGGSTSSDIDKQTNIMTNGFDSSHGNSVNSDLSAGLNEFQTAEDSLFTTASSGLDDFSFFNFASIPAMVTGMSFVSSIMTSWFNQAGGSSGVGIVLSILFSIMLVAMVLGLYRWYQSKGGKD